MIIGMENEKNVHTIWKSVAYDAPVALYWMGASDVL